MELFDIDAEKAVLGAVLTDDQCFDKVLALLPSEEGFYQYKHKIIYSSFLELFAKKQAINLITVSNYIASKGLINEIGGRSYLSELTPIGLISAHVESNAQVVRDKYLSRCVVSAGSLISELGRKGDGLNGDTLQNIFSDLASKLSSTKNDIELTAWVERQKQINSFELNLKELLPLQLYEFLWALSKNTYANFPIEASFTFLLPILAGLGGTKFRVSDGITSKYCLLWSMVVMDSSIGKSPLLTPLEAPLCSWEEVWEEEYKLELKKFNQSKERKKRNEAAQEFELEPPVKKEIILKGATMEGAKTVHKANPQGMTWIADEIMSIFHGFDQFKSSKGADEAVFLEMLSGGSSKVTRVTGSSFIPEMAISGTGGIQPEVAYELLRKRNNNNGLWGRFLFYSCDIQQTIMNEETPRPLDTSMLNGLYSYFYTAPKKQFNFKSKSQIKAISMFLNDEKNEAEPSMKAYIGKAYHFFLKFTIILHLIDSFFKKYDVPPDLISEEIVDNAFAITNFYITQAEKLFGEKSENAAQKLYKKIDKFVQDKGGEATLRDIQRGLMRKNSTLEVEAIFREMEALGFGFIEKKGKSIKFLKGEK